MKLLKGGSFAKAKPRNAGAVGANGIRMFAEPMMVAVAGDLYDLAHPVVGQCITSLC